MKTYRIFKGSDSIFNNFNNIEEAQIWALENYDNTWNVELASESQQISPLTIEKRLPMDIDFGYEIIGEFLKDNRLYGYIPIQDSINLLNKFSDIEKLCRLGAIKDVQTLMQAVIVDDIFTQERKDKYLSMITEYLNYYK